MKTELLKITDRYELRMTNQSSWLNPQVSLRGQRDEKEKELRFTQSALLLLLAIIFIVTTLKLFTNQVHFPIGP